MNFFDLHCDTAFECFKTNKIFLKNDLSVSGEKGEVFENWHQVFAIWIRDDAKNPFDFYKNIINNFISIKCYFFTIAFYNIHILYTSKLNIVCITIFSFSS